MRLKLVTVAVAIGALFSASGLARTADANPASRSHAEPAVGNVNPLSAAASSKSFGKNEKSSLGRSAAALQLSFTGLPFSVPANEAFTGPPLLSVPITIESRSDRSGGISVG